MTIADDMAIFDAARKLYPGTVYGLDVEFDRFCKWYKKDWRDIIPLLIPAIEAQIKWRASKKGFVAEWKYFKTWLNPNNKCWTEEQMSDKKAVPKCMVADCGRDSECWPSTHGGLKLCGRHRKRQWCGTRREALMPDKGE